MGLKGTANQTQFEDHPVGKYSGVVYRFSHTGIRDGQYGPKERWLVGIESEDVEMEDGRPFSAWLNGNLSWGSPDKRGGQGFPKFQEMRQDILDRDLTKEEWYDFDAEVEIIGVRVRYKITHAPKEDGSGNWVNTEIIERDDDQANVEMHNDPIIHYTFEDYQAYKEQRKAEYDTKKDGGAKDDDLPF